MVTWVSLKHLVDSLDWAHFNRHERVRYSSLVFSEQMSCVPFVCKERRHGALFSIQTYLSQLNYLKEQKSEEEHLPSSVLSRTGNRFYGLKNTWTKWFMAFGSVYGSWMCILPPTRIKHCTFALVQNPGIHKPYSRHNSLVVFQWIKNTYVWMLLN